MPTIPSVSVFYSVQDMGYGALWVLAVVTLGVLILTVALWHVESLLEDVASLVVFHVLAALAICAWWCGHGK